MTESQTNHRSVPARVTVDVPFGPDGETKTIEHVATRVEVENGHLIVADANRAKTAAVYAPGRWCYAMSNPHPDLDGAEAVVQSLGDQIRNEARDEVRRAVLNLAPNDKEFAEDVAVIFVENGWSEA